MRILALLIILCCGLMNCRDRQEELTYPDEKIAGVMVDLYITAEILDDTEPATRDSLEEIFRQQIENRHSVDLDEMQWQIERLQKDPAAYSEVHALVRDSLESLEKLIRSADLDNLRNRK